MGRIQDSINYMVDAMVNRNVGYSQGSARHSITRLVTSPGSAVDADCSSSIAYAAWRAGYLPAYRPDAWTGNLRGILTAAGYQSIPWSRGASLHAGDVLLKEPGHVAMYVGDIRGIGTSLVAEAWINERGATLGGTPGDQTGGETRIIGYWGHPDTASSRWTHILRPPADTITTEEDDMPTAREIADTILDTPIKRQGGPTGTTTLRTEIAWMTANQGRGINAATAAEKAATDLGTAIAGVAAATAKAVLDEPIARAGGAKGTTSLRTEVAWATTNQGRAINEATAATKAVEALSAEARAARAAGITTTTKEN
ncbi:MAG: hypothetical protein Q4C85_08680 [Actinomyces sp.]|uniref:hypothetical protein n=1 Tax=Actinomyces sp. TaxID=29317 RepID=UPI0026DD1C06|nr:hypothetical protein [Actinomyces sp.]MDO4243813.1 hypothetical protein [Actinomyces sp.]